MADHTDSSILVAPPKLDKPTAPRRRAKVACKSCNARRVKCDVAEVQPCWHCRSRQTPCELIDSKRGKYFRKKPDQPQPPPPPPQEPSHNVKRPSQGFVASGSVDHAPQVSPTSLSLDVGGNILYSPDDGTEMSPPARHEEEGPEMLFARIAEPSPTEHSPGPIRQSRRSYYLGGSFSLAYIVKTVCSPTGGEADAVKVHYPIPATVADRPIAPRANTVQEPGPTADAFITPRRDVADRLIRIFFDNIHPAYPVFDRRSFTYQYKQGQASVLSLQTIFLFAITICDEDLLRESGFSDRNTARRTYYLRAKALYDSDYEQDRATLAAVLFLLGFWWDGPEDQKDTWHWLGCAISLAQSLGMHRSAAQSGMSKRDQSLWKRIWWSIYVRDRHAAAALGRPCRIRDEDCDVEMLEEADLLIDVDFDERLVPTQEKHHISYVIEMAKLAIIQGDILLGEFSPRRHLVVGHSMELLASRLEEWESQLPPDMCRLSPDGSFGAPFWASMLQASYRNFQILLFQPKSVEPQSSSDSRRDGMARMAADSLTRIVEDLLSVGTLKYGQLHLVPSIFSALSIHAILIRRRDPILRQLAENKARQCMLAMSELAKSWPVGGWILRLFVNLMRQLTGSTQGLFTFSGASQSNPSSSHATNQAAVLQLPSPRQEPSIGNMLTRMATPNSVERCDTENQPQSMVDIDQPRDQMTIDYFQQAANQLLSDTLWADGVENDYDFEFPFYNAGVYPPPPF